MPAVFDPTQPFSPVDEALAGTAPANQASPVDAALAAAAPKPVAPVAASAPVFDATQPFTPLSEPAAAPAPPSSTTFDPSANFTKQFTPQDILNQPTEALDKEKDFNPTDFGHQFEDQLNADPALKQKVLEIYRLRERTGRSITDAAEHPLTTAKDLTVGAAKTGVGVVKSLAQGAGQLFVNANNTFNPAVVVPRLLGAASVGGQGAKAGVNAELNRVAQSAAEIAAAPEAAITGTQALLRKSVRDSVETAAALDPTGFVTGVTGVKPVSQLTDKELASRFESDVAGKKSAAEAARGAGYLMQAVGLHADELKTAGIEIRPEVVAKLQTIEDPLNLVLLGEGGAVGAVGKVGGRYTVETIAQAASKEQASALVRGLTNAAKVAGAVTELGGKGVELAGTGIKATVGEITKVVGHGAVTGGIAGGIAGSAAGGHFGITKTLLAAKVAGPVIEYTGKGLQTVGRGITAAAPVLGDIASEYVKGYGEGLLITAPFLIGADQQEREGLLGAAALGGIARGGVRALGHGAVGARIAAEAAQDKLAESIFKEVNQSKPPTDPAFAYGTDPRLDAESAKNIAKLDTGAAQSRAARVARIEKVFDAETNRLDAEKPLSPGQFEKRAKLREETLAKIPETITVQQNLLGWVKDLFKDTPVEFHVVDDPGMMRQTDGQSGRGYTVKTGQTIAPDGTVKPLVRVFLNGDVESLPHEMLHALGEIDAPGYKGFRDKVSKTLTSDQQKSFEQIYNTVHNGGLPEAQWKNRLTPEQVSNEIAAELFSRTVLGEDLSGVSPGLKKWSAKFAAGLLEKMGIPLGKLTAAQAKDFVSKGAKRKAGFSTLGLRPGVEAQALGHTFVQGLLKQANEGKLTAAPEKSILGIITPADIINFRPNAITPEGGGPPGGPGGPAGPAAPTSPGGPPPAPAMPGAIADWLTRLDKAVAGETTSTSPGGTPPAPAPATPGATTPGVPPAVNPPSGPRNIRVTRERQDAFGIPEAQATAAALGNPDVLARVNEISEVIGTERPALELEYKSVKDDGSPGEPTPRNPRRNAQEEERAAIALGEAPENVRELVQKIIVPVRWVTVGKGTLKSPFKPELIAMSLDKVAANVQMVVKDAAGKAGAEVPYDRTPAGDALSEQGWSDVIADLKTYARNQSNGYKGDGGKLVRPDLSFGMVIPDETPGFTPTEIKDKNKADFLNMVQGFKLPFTTKPGGKGIPANLKGQKLAEINFRKVEPPVKAAIREQDILKQTFPEKVTEPIFPGRGPMDIAEPNPLRNQFWDAGVDVGKLIEGVERISPEQVTKVTPRPKIDYQAPVSDIIRGGFLPGKGKSPGQLLPGGEEGGATMFIKRQTVDEIGREVLDANPEQWQKLTSDIGGLTGAAYKLGNRLKDPADVVKLWKFESAATAEYAKARATQDFDGMMLAATKKQFFTEALETATGMNPGKQATIARVLGEGWKPPFPEGAKGQLLPKSKDPRAVEFAAIRNSETGEIFPGSTHGEAMLKAGLAAGTPKGEFSLSAAYANPNYEQGFVTQGGDFLTRSEALKRVEEIGQISPKDLLGSSQLQKGENLESVGFEVNRNFLPKTEAGLPLAEGDIQKVADRAVALGSLETRSKRGNVITPESQFLPGKIGPRDVSEDSRKSLWLNPTGEFFDAGRYYHQKWAVENLGMDSEDAIKKGWIQVTVDPNTAIFVKGKPSRPSLKALEDLAFSLGRPVRDEKTEKVIISSTDELGGGKFLPKKRKQTPEEQVAETDYSKYDTSPAKTRRPIRLTGWIFPNQKFVPLDSNFHENYLAEHSADLNKRFGTSFSTTPDVEDRLRALNKGFVRIRGGLQGELRTQGAGGVVVELNEKFFRKNRPTLENYLTDNADSIDNLTVNLLNDKGNVKDYQRVTVHELDGAEKANALLGVLDDLRLRGPEGQMLPGGEETLPGLNLPSEERAKQMRPRGLRGVVKITTPKAAQDFPLEPGDIVIKKRR